MSAPDENDKLLADQLPADPKSKVVPLNPAAQRKAASEARVLTVQEILAASMSRAFSRTRPEVCRTGIHALDKATGGIQPGFGWVVGADTSWGKSSFVVLLADVNIREKRNVLIVSNEDDEALYGDRLMQRRAQVNAERLRDGALESEEMQRVVEVVNRGERVPVYLDARRDKRVETVAKQVQELVLKHDIQLVLFDYLQEFESSKQFKDERTKFKHIASVLRTTVKNLKRASVIFSQLTITDPGKIPSRHNIRECRDVANAAEVILIGFEPEDDIKDRKDKNRVIIQGGTKCVLIDKVKNGARGRKLPLRWNADCAYFEEVKSPEQLEQEATERMVDDIAGGMFEDAPQLDFDGRRA